MAAQGYVHPTAEVADSAVVGDGVRIWNWTKVREDARIGDGSQLGQCCFVDEGVSIGANCKIQNSVSIYRGVTLEDAVFVGPSAVFTNDMYPRAVSPDWQIVPTLVERGASIGANATVVCGVTIGAFSMVGAGSVVTRDVPPFALVVGSPAQIIGAVDEAGRRVAAGGDATR